MQSPDQYRPATTPTRATELATAPATMATTASITFQPIVAHANRRARFDNCSLPDAFSTTPFDHESHDKTDRRPPPRAAARRPLFCAADRACVGALDRAPD